MIVAYLDCFSGIAGNMILGACVDLGVEPKALTDVFAPLEMEGFDLVVERVLRNRVSGILLKVKVVEGHVHRKLGDVISLLDRLDLTPRVRSWAEDAFRRLAEAEGRVHGRSPDEISFHEVGALDAVVDVVGSAWCFERLGIERVVASPVHVGTGFVRCMHGQFPVPAPATAYLLEGVTTYSRGIESEMVTPTGASLLRALADEFGPQPRMKIRKVGYGCGDRDLKEIPNCLRILVGETSNRFIEDEVIQIETNLDDMNPEFFDPLMEHCFAKGALDVSFSPLQMKKNRPGILLTVLVHPENEMAVTELLLRETTTLGVRSVRMGRRILRREEGRVETRFGPVRIKIGMGEGICKISPEYEDCRRLAEDAGVPIRVVYRAALLSAGQEEE